MSILKKTNAWLHLWLGLASGVIVVIVSFTGCILVFESEIKDLTLPHLNAENPENAPLLPPSRLWPIVKQALPDKEIYSIWYHGDGKTAHFSLNSDSAVYVNPYSGKIVAMVDEEDFFHFVLDGHTSLWIENKVGQGIVSYGTLIFFIITLTGVVLWWPKRWTRSIRDKSFKIKWKAKFKRVNYDLHNVLGFYSLTVALIIAATGLIMAFGWFSKSVYWLTSGGEAIPANIRAYSDTTIVRPVAGLENVDRAWKKGISEIGVYDKNAIIVSFPQKQSEPISLCTDMRNGSWRYVYLDQYTLDELPSTQTQIDKLGVGQWLRRTNYALHVGAIGNWPTKILYFLASLVCTSLPITGFFVWWGKRKKARKESHKKSGRLAVSVSRI